MALLHYLWSRVAANNATADGGVNWQEGQAPSSVNDSARAMMASAAGFRDDISGAIVTGGTSTAYTVASYQVFDTLAHMDKMMIAFTPHATSGATVTLNVDGLGAKPLRTAPSTELLAGTLLQGTPYVALYNASDAAFYLHGFYSNPYNIPLGGGMDYWGTTVPNSSFAFANGTSISQTTYASLYTLFGSNRYGSDGGGLFPLPDVRGRFVLKRDDMGGGATNRTTTAGGGLDGATLGAVGGAQNITLVAGQIPSLTSVNAAQAISVTGPAGHTMPYDQTMGSVPATGGAQALPQGGSVGSNSFTGNNSISVTYANASPSVAKTTPAGIVCNYIIRII